MSNNRTFIVIDGPDFSGKSTLMEALVTRLQGYEVDHLVMREPGCFPGKSSLAEDVRKVLLADREETVHPETDLLLHMAYRIQNVRNVICPALAEGKWVLTDRFMFSTWALNVQAHLDTHPHLPDLFYGLMPYVASGIPEPLTFLLDTPRSVREERAANSPTKLDRYESQSKDVLDRIDAAYEHLKSTPSAFVLDGTLPTEQLVDRILEVVREYNEQIQQQMKDEAKAVLGEQGAKLEEQASKTPEERMQELRDELDADADWTVEAKAREYVTNHIEPVLEQLFPGATGDKLAAYADQAREFAYKAAIAVYRKTSEDRTIFHPSRIGQINQKVHSVLNYSYMKDQWQDMFKDEQIEYTKA